MKATKKHYKFGVEVLYTVSQAIMMDKDKQNNLWKEVMERKIKDIDALNSFIPHDNKESLPKDYEFIPVHFVFEVRYDSRR